MAGGRRTRTVRVGQLPREQDSRDNDKFAKGLDVFSGQLSLFNQRHALSMQAQTLSNYTHVHEMCLERNGITTFCVTELRFSAPT